MKFLYTRTVSTKEILESCWLLWKETEEIMTETDHKLFSVELV